MFRGQLLQLLWRRGEGIRPLTAFAHKIGEPEQTWVDTFSRGYQARAGEGGRLKKAGTFRTPLNDGWGHLA